MAAAPYAAEAEQALFELGDYLFRRRRFQESVAHFDRLLGEYPESVLAPAAEFRAALATYRQAEKQKNNDGLLLDAYGRFTACLDKYPDLRERPEAERYHRDIQSRLAEKILEAGRYYERNGNRKAAAIYYRRVGAEYPGTPAAVQASEWLKKMEG
ncbi:MAG: Outer membrane protein assembly factor BamD [candidate division TA06 bacterium ADurb.Bin417]|uniref:Outer membrane protein assembly factor BamD n=1 Tax=candidate division TA06 bacterium ADurb.Bin417 TaxID=1852828 RepID=A0A1V5MK48_UNCT6|nr:MAG: Outer membrane protein assembly factor BamD [candidate division TA06 bacterium ADurb.Bin417]